MEENDVVRIKLVRHEWPDERAARRKKQRQLLLAVLTCLLIFTAGFATAVVMNPSTSATSSVNNSKYSTIYDIMRNFWYFGKDVENLDETLIDGSINGLVNSGGDIHTQYLDSKRAKQFMTSLEGNFVGIGIQYYQIDQDYIVDRVFNDSPAQKAGMIAGDFIRKVNGISTSTLTMDEIKEEVTGEAGSEVVVSVERKGELIDLTMERAEVNSSVFGYIRGDVGVLEISTFAETSGSEVEKYLAYFKENKIHRLIIDLRNNTGGYLTTTVEIGSQLMPKDTIVLKEENREGSLIEYRTKDNYEMYDYDAIAILVNGETASASEVLTAALKENCNATVIGTLTYGKGTVQTSIPFRDGSLIKYTKAEWLTPNNKKINGVGITPDYIVELPEALEISAVLSEEVYAVDTVSEACQVVQYYLDFLGYPIDRFDGYYSQETYQSVTAYQLQANMESDGLIDVELMRRLLSDVSVKWHNEKAIYDTQMNKALEVVHGK